MNKIQFIVVGWHYHQMEFYESLKELNDNNEEIDVFWSCHKEPTNYIKENFKYKLFPNVGEEFIAYQQAIEYLNIEDDTICFFVHDDIIIKNWNFIDLCIQGLNKHKFLGNCFNYPLPEFDPTKQHHDGIGITEDFDNKPIADYALDETKHWFDKKIAPIMVVRGSFICCKYKDLKHIHGFEPRKEAWIALTWDEKLKCHNYRGGVGQSRFGNLFMFMFSYKINRVFGSDSISYLSNRYLDSDYIYEMGRGKIDTRNPML
tara:strand:+ start:4521 stop:5300 length:780 start_codon:yes stop_codon:yes gene_type:complete